MNLVDISFSWVGREVALDTESMGFDPSSERYNGGRSGGLDEAFTRSFVHVLIIVKPRHEAWIGLEVMQRNYVNSLAMRVPQKM